jgi:hypothetical protein
MHHQTINFVKILNACASLVETEENRSILQQIFSDFESDVFDLHNLKHVLNGDAWSVFNKKPSLNIDRGAILEAIARYISGCVKVYNEITLHLVFYCQLVAMQLGWMNAFAIMLQWSRLQDL